MKCIEADADAVAGAVAEWKVHCTVLSATYKDLAVETGYIKIKLYL